MTNRSDRQSSPGNLTRVVAWVLAISYLVGAPLAAYLEYNGQILSERFDYPPELIYITCVVQIFCSVALLLPRLAPWAAALLTLIALGAVASHLKIGSPLTSLPAFAYAAVQIWFIRASRAKALSQK